MPEALREWQTVKNMNKKSIIGSMAAAIIVAGLCLWQGIQAKNKPAQSAAQNSQNDSGRVQGSRTKVDSVTVSGTVASVGDKSITLNLGKGGSTIVFCSGMTPILKTTKLAAEDLAAGQSVTVSGAKSENDIVTVTTMMVRDYGGTLSGMPQQGTRTGQKIARGQKAGDTNVAGRMEDNNRRFVNGEITAIDGPKITIKLSDGTESAVILANDARIIKSETATIKDVVAGINISARGSKGPDGSVIARTITIGEAVMLGAGGPVPENNNMFQNGQPDAD